MASSLKQLPRVLVVEYPGSVRNVDKALQTLGGEQGISTAARSKGSFLECRFRPDDPLSRPLFAGLTKAPGLLVRISKKRCTENEVNPPNQSSGEPKSASRTEPASQRAPSQEIDGQTPSSDKPQEEGFDARIVGVVQEAFKFEGMADFQIVPDSESFTAAKRLRADSILQQELEDYLAYDQPMLTVPPMLSRNDLPESYLFRDKTRPWPPPSASRRASKTPAPNPKAPASTPKASGPTPASKTPQAARPAAAYHSPPAPNGLTTGAAPTAHRPSTPPTGTLAAGTMASQPMVGLNKSSLAGSRIASVRGSEGAAPREARDQASGQPGVLGCEGVVVDGDGGVRSAAVGVGGGLTGADANAASSDGGFLKETQKDLLPRMGRVAGVNDGMSEAGVVCEERDTAGGKGGEKGPEKGAELRLDIAMPDLVEARGSQQASGIGMGEASTGEAGEREQGDVFAMGISEEEIRRAVREVGVMLPGDDGGAGFMALLRDAANGQD